MDPFTEKLLERTRLRRENLQKKMNDSNISPRKRRTPLADDNNVNRERQVSPAKRITNTNPGHRAVENEIKPDTPAVKSVQSRMRNLSNQRAGWDDCDCPSDSHAMLQDEYVPSPRRTEDKTIEPKTEITPPQPKTRKSRFAALAANINNWEDDTNHPMHKPEPEKKPARIWKPPVPTTENKQPTATPRSNPVQNVNSPVKPSRANTSTAKSMTTNPGRERQAPEASSAAKYQSPVKNSWQPVKAPASPNAKSTQQQQLQAAVRPTANRQEANRVTQPMQTRRNPATVVEEPTPVKRVINKTEPNHEAQQPVPSKRTRQPSQEQSIQQKTVANSVSAARPGAAAHQSSRVKTFAEQISKQSQELSPQSVSAKAKSIQQQLLKQQRGGWQTNEINAKVQKERNAELEMLRNRWKVNPELPKPTDEEEEEEEEEEVPSPPKKQKTPIEEIIKEDVPPSRTVPYYHQQPKSSNNAAPAKPTSDRTEVPNLKRKAPQPPVTTNSGGGNNVIQNTGTGPQIPSHPHSSYPGSSKYKKYNPATAQLGVIPGPARPPRANKNEPRPNRAQAIAEYMKRQAVPPQNEVQHQKKQEVYRQNTERKEPVMPKKTEQREEPRREEQKRVIEDIKYVDDDDDDDDDEEKRNQDDDDDDDGEDEDNELDIMGELDDLLDEALAKEEEEEKKQKEAEEKRRQEEQQKRKQSVKFAEEPRAPPRPRKNSVNNGGKVHKSNSADNINSAVQGESNAPMMYSVECYRSQRKISHRPPAKQVIKREAQKTNIERQESRIMTHMSVKEKIQTLMEDISQQQSIIHQTSQALNLIEANGNALKGTIEEVEAERLLLIATQRRLACLAEVQRLKQEHQSGRGRQYSGGRPSRGSVTIRDIRLPFKTEYIFSMGSKQDQQIHHFLVLVRNGAHIIATHLLSTLDGISGDCLPFTNMIKMNELGSDFYLDVEVYSMQTKRQAVKDKKGNLLRNITPRKSKRGGQAPGVSSPGGPSAVRSSHFKVVGSSRVVLSNSNNNKFTLSKVPFLCPLEGNIHMTVSCHMDAQVQERGFLTMFDDVKGFGAWHRRWCVLSNGYISYWKYPDDERRKAPIGSISLKECITKHITTVAREFCARPNTFELVTSRPANDTDEDNLIISVEGTVTHIKWWISADTKEERIVWVDKLNKALVNMRQWSKDSKTPYGNMI